VLVSEDSPLDEGKRDELVDHFEVTYQAGGDLAAEDLDADEEVEDELDVHELEIDGE